MGVSAERTREIEKYLSKENLKKYLPIYSANYIATKLFMPDFKSTAGTVIDRAKTFGIETHNFSSAMVLTNTKELKKKFCQEKWGVDNPSQAKEIKDKKEKSAIAKYGVNNVFQAEEIKNKSRETMIAKYGVPYITMFKPSSGYMSNFHSEISKRLEEKGILHQCEVGGRFQKVDETTGKTYSPVVDIWIEDSNIVIECYGDFWHANPNKYKASDTFNTWEGVKTAKEIWDKDKLRIEHIESFGCKVHIIWESEFNHNKQESIGKLINAIKSNCIN